MATQQKTMSDRSTTGKFIIVIAFITSVNTITVTIVVLIAVVIVVFDITVANAHIASLLQ